LKKRSRGKIIHTGWANVILTSKYEIFKNGLVDSKTDTLYEYTSDPKFLFTWDIVMGWKVNRFLNTTLSTGSVIDENNLFDVIDEAGNMFGMEKSVQFKEVLAISVIFSY
jgi:hypothetical protein